MNNFSFKKGYGQVMNKDASAVRRKIMKALKITTLQGFRNRLAGNVEPRVSERAAIEKIFAEYGIKNIWGE